MFSEQHSKRLAICATALALALVLASPAAAGTLYAWRSDDGTHSFTDDPKRVPPRYRDRVERRDLEKLGDYERFTPQDPAAGEHYAARLGERLAALRRASAPRATSPRPLEPGATHTLALRTGGAHSPTLELRSGAGHEPVVVETLFTRPQGRMVTRQSVVVRQGDATLAIVKPRLRHWNVATDIHAEADLSR